MKQASDSLLDDHRPRRQLSFFRIVAWIVHFTLLMSVLLGFGARYINPTHFWIPQVFGTFLPLLAVMLIPGLALAAIKKRKLTLVYLALILLSVVRFWGGAKQDIGGELLTSDKALTLVTYNARQFVGHDRPGKAAELQRLLEKNAYTLASFQEMGFRWIENDANVYDNMLTEVGQAVGMRAYLDEEGFSVTNRQQILGRPELLHLEQINIASEQHRREQYLLRLHFEWLGKEAVLYNLHLQTFGYQKPWEDPDFSLFDITFLRRYVAQFRRAYQLRALEAQKIKDLISEETLPVIVTGDFNSTIHNWSYHTIAAGMKDAYLASGQRWGATFPRSFPVFRIDHVLVSRDLRVNRVRIPPFDASDHLPLEVQLFWP